MWRDASFLYSGEAKICVSVADDVLRDFVMTNIPGMYSITCPRLLALLEGGIVTA